MDKMSVTSPIDSLKNGFEAVYGGYGRCHTRKSWKIQSTKVSERIQRWYDVLCQIKAEKSNSLGAACYQLSIKVNRPYLSYVLYLNMI